MGGVVARDAGVDAVDRHGRVERCENFGEVAVIGVIFVKNRLDVAVELGVKLKAPLRHAVAEKDDAYARLAHIGILLLDNFFDDVHFFTPL